MRRLLYLLPILALTVGCQRDRDPTPTVDVLGEETATAENKPNRGRCEAKNPDGKRCDKRVCKKDETGVGDCSDFGKKCIDNDYHYSGTKDAGTCSRIL